MTHEVGLWSHWPGVCRLVPYLFIWSVCRNFKVNFNCWRVQKKLLTGCGYHRRPLPFPGKRKSKLWCKKEKGEKNEQKDECKCAKTNEKSSRKRKQLRFIFCRNYFLISFFFGSDRLDPQFPPPFHLVLRRIIDNETELLPS